MVSSEGRRRKRHLDGEDDDESRAKRAAGSAGDSFRLWAEAINATGAVAPIGKDQVGEHLIIPVIGGYNTGKSALINMLAAESLVVSAPVEQTAVPWAILPPAACPPSLIEETLPEVVFVTAQRSLFKNIVLVDTPGYGGVDGVDGCLAPLLALSHAIIICISSHTPVTRSDLTIVEEYSKYKRPIYVVLTKADLCSSPDELLSITSSVSSRLSPILHFQPRVHPTSSSPSQPDLTAAFSRVALEPLDSDADRILSMLSVVALDKLTVHHRRTIDALVEERDRHRAIFEEMHHSIASASSLCAKLVSDVAICRSAIRRQAQQLGPSAVLSSPLSSLRSQLAASILGASLPDLVSPALDHFVSESSQLLRQQEVAIERDDVVSTDDNTGVKRIATATSTAGLFIATALNPVVGIGSGVLWLAARKIWRRDGDEDQDEEVCDQLKLVGAPMLALDSIGDWIAGLSRSLVEPLRARAAAEDHLARLVQERIDQLELVMQKAERDHDHQLHHQPTKTIVDCPIPLKVE